MQESWQFQEAIRLWRECLGPQMVLADDAALESAGRGTFAAGQSVLAVIMPGTRDEVRECLRIAGQFRIPVYPISQGKNWGYGSKVPPRDAVVMSLERMNRIVEFNKELAYIAVEPGVTFAQVHAFLEEQEAGLIAPSIGSLPQASLIGNALERGIGKGQYGDRLRHACNMEVVLAGGEVIRTGFGHFDKAKSAHTYNGGLGPSLDGLFAQSNFGVVTQMTFWLLPKPGYFQSFFYRLSSDGQLPAVIDALRTLRLEGTLTGTATLSNDYRILAMKRQFPGQRYDVNRALPEEYMNEVRRNVLGSAMWFGDDAILAATKAIGRARAKRVKQLLAPLVDDMVFFDDGKAALFRKLAAPIRWVTGLDVRELLYFHHHSLYLGIPMSKQIAICYFRKNKPAPHPMDLDRDRCGAIWISPSVPFSGDEVGRTIEILKGGYARFGFEPNMGLNLMSERNIAFTAAIIYDRDVPGHDAKAMECYEYLMDALKREGLIPYRLGIQSMDGVMTDSEEYRQLLLRLKRAVDPDGIIAPGRYGIEAQ